MVPVMGMVTVTWPLHILGNYR